MTRARILTLFTWLLFLPYAVWGDEQASLELVIMATTDLHGKLHHTGEQPGGMAEAASVIAELRSTADHSLLFDVGDAFEGSPAADYYALVDTVSPHPVAWAMKKMGYAAMVLGNHEFTYGLPFLKRVIQQLSFPVLGANLSSQDPFWEEYAVVNAGPLQILVIGTVTPWTALAEAGVVKRSVQFADQITCLNDRIPLLKEKYSPDITCVLAHTGMGEEGGAPLAEGQGHEIATQVPGIDALFLGHSHRTLNEKIDGVHVLQAGARGSHVAVLRLTVAKEKDGYRIIGSEGDIRAVADADPDSLLLDGLRKAATPVQHWLTEEIGSVATPLLASGSYARHDDISGLLLNVMIEQGQGDAALIAAPPDDVRLNAGPITREALYELQPYLNRLVTIKLSGNQLAACLEEAARTWAPYPFDGSYPPPLASGKNRGSFLVAGGVEYILDYTKPYGERLVTLTKDGSPLGETDTLLVVVTNYRKTGAGGYHWLQNAPVIKRSARWLRTYAEDWFRQRPGYRPEDPQGWYSLPTYQGTWAHPVLDMFLERFGPEHYVTIAWNSFPGAGITKQLMDDILGEAHSFFLPEAQDGKVLITRASLLRQLVRRLPDIPAYHGAGHQRFCDLHPEPVVSLWDSVVTSGLVAYVSGDSLKPDLPVTTGEYAGFLLNARYRALTVAASNDFHGHLEPNQRRRQGGSAALGGWLTRERSRNPEGVILLDAGDAMQGTPISNLFEGRSTINVYNHLGYDALAVGNHEFDWGQDILKERIVQAEFPFLGANVLAAGTGETVDWLERHVMVERGGSRVAVIGVCTAATPWMSLDRNMEGIEFQGVVDAFEECLPSVQDEDPDLIILVGHLGLEREGTRWTGEARVLAEVATDRVDMFFSGHNHQMYSTSVSGLPVLQGGSYGRAVSVARTWVDRLGGLSPWVNPSVVSLSSIGLEDPKTAALVHEYSVELAPKTQVVITELREPISTRAGRTGEMPMGRLIAEAQRRMVGAQVALMNPGGVRRDLGIGPVTWEDLFQAQPFGNTLVKATLSGRELVRALEQGIHPSGSCVQVAGIELWIDRSRGFGQRIIKAQLDDGTPVEPHVSYTVVFNNFMSGGGDSYTVLRDATSKVDTGIGDLDALIEYLKSFSLPASIQLEERMHAITPERR